MKRRTPETTLGGINLLEESVHALRRATPGTLLCYFLGSVPFVLAVLFFWSDMSRSGLAEQHLVPGAIGLTALFVWMKVWQSIFAAKLSAEIAGESASRLTVGEWIRVIASQTMIHSTGLILIPIAAQIILPIAWVYAFYQNATVFGLKEPSLGPLVRRSSKQAFAAPGQNHIALSVLSLFGFFVFLNIAITMLVVPHFLKMLLGVDTHFTLSIESAFNTTFLAAVIGVTYLCFDPLVKATYVLRCFYGEARSTGEDLRVTLRSLRNAMATVVIAAFLLMPSGIRAAQTTQSSPTTPPAGELNQSIDEVLNRPEYTWRTPRAKEKKVTADEGESAMWKRIRDWLKNTARAVRDWLEKLFRSKATPTTPGNFSISARGIVYFCTVIAFIAILFLLWMLWRSRSRSNQAALEATPATPVPDLASEDVTGEELPVDGWMSLALELLERGDLRLAMRAFYLSSLAHLAARNLVSIAKFKSNRDYERELHRRSHALPEVSQTFSENVTVFDRVWYGMHEINAELLHHFRSNVERIRGC